MENHFGPIGDSFGSIGDSFGSKEAPLDSIGDSFGSLDDLSRSETSAIGSIEPSTEPIESAAEPIGDFSRSIGSLSRGSAHDRSAAMTLFRGRSFGRGAPESAPQRLAKRVDERGIEAAGRPHACSVHRDRNDG